MTANARDRLTRMIDRLVTQRACLDRALVLVGQTSGCVLEIGLGKGRTYDWLRHRTPGRRIHAFDREVHCPDDVRPPEADLWLGDFRDTLVRARGRLGSGAVLVHADIGSDDRARDAALARAISPLIEPLLAPGAVVLSDRELTVPGCTPIDLPPEVQEWPYFMWRRGSGGTLPRTG